MAPLSANAVAWSIILAVLARLLCKIAGYISTKSNLRIREFCVCTFSWVRLILETHNASHECIIFRTLYRILWMHFFTSVFFCLPFIQWVYYFMQYLRARRGPWLRLAYNALLEKSFRARYTHIANIAHIELHRGIEKCIEIIKNFVPMLVFLNLCLSRLNSSLSQNQCFIPLQLCSYFNLIVHSTWMGF